MEECGIKNTHEALKKRLLDYIVTAYFGKNDDLREMCIEEIKRKGVLWQEPYIEANLAYKTMENGIENSNLPEDIKDILKEMRNENLGVFTSPYAHQIESIEAFYSGKDILVSTGTGSGKTECFMWPMVTKLMQEAKKKPMSWNNRGVRVVMLYPMNALVADQIARLRKMIGDSEGKFKNIFKNICGENRIPTFGMYTGRTPYPGKMNKSKDIDLANTLERDLLDKTDEVKKQLIDLGKYPSKKDLSNYIEKLRKNQHITDVYDAEMITRFEMQKNAPDILITNYSMLEYMLMRNIEQNIWIKTKEWLADENNKLLFIIDEAHMYKGAAGGEVSLLIRRLFNKLNIDRSRVQFILTTASMPSNSKEAINKFYMDLTGTEDVDNLVTINGIHESVNIDNGIEPDSNIISEFDISKLHKPIEEKLAAIKEFSILAGISDNGCSFSEELEVENWLYDKLSKFKPLLRIMKQCRGNATSFTQLSKIAFPNCPIEIAKKATSVVLSIAPLAKNKNGQVLLPARLHMMFRGLQKLYACSNPNCSEKKIFNDLPIGKLYFGVHNDTCECGGKIYEVLNDRNCGALFYRGYIDKTKDDNQFIWNDKNALRSNEFKEVHYYIVSNDSNYKTDKNTQIIWLNSLTGKIVKNDNNSDKPHYVKLAFSEQNQDENSNLQTFSKCPKCKKTKLTITDFATKGNEPFYNVVAEQLVIQPKTIFGEELEKNPNGGRKVLLFSDSRQKAARLAKELTEVSDEDALRTAIVVSAKILEEWATKDRRNVPSMDLLYTVFLEVASRNNLKFFYGSNEEKLAKDIENYKEEMEKVLSNRRRALDYYRIKKRYFSTTPELFSKYLLKNLCSSFRSLTDLGLCWIEPLMDDLEDAVYDLEDEGIEIEIEELLNLFIAWIDDVLSDSYAFDPYISLEVRKSISKFPDFGIRGDSKLTKKYVNLLKEKGYDDNQIDCIFEKLKSFTSASVNTNSDTYYLNPEIVTLKYGVNETWYKCPMCGKILPVTLWGKCGACCEGEPIEMTEKEFESISFWRNPILRTLSTESYESMVRINTEEHTAQLSHKDQKINTWSTTEEYEMRFQNIDIENKGPVDVLSCTTTMEVGIDIGALTAVGLRNIPPMRENYQQRAGRAGRRSLAISTIVTYTDNGPHDSYYFHKPDSIISGEPSSPGIDMYNDKLLNRHYNVAILTQYLLEKGNDASELGVISFMRNYLDEFISNLSKLKLSIKEICTLIPTEKQGNIEKYRDNLIGALLNLKEKIDKFESNYHIEFNGKYNEKKLLDVLLEEGIFPTYSFPRNVVGFEIEDSDGKKLLQKPDRSLDLALSEFAPGRVLVVDKKTYKSGGIYSFHSKFNKENQSQPARPYFNSKDYFKEIYYCTNKSCNWVDVKKPENDCCPFCGEEDIKTQYLLRPWGFAPVNGKAINDAEADAEISYAELPCYSTPIKNDEMKKVKSYEKLRYGKLSNQELLIMNQGPEGKGFTICKDCGAAVSGNNIGDIKKISQPFTFPYARNKKCNHNDIVNTFLGHQFLTDMILFEIELDRNKIDCMISNYWIDSAALTMSEAMALAASQLLDIDFNDIKSGYRIRNSKGNVYIDIYLFDSLSSGAGYSSLLEKKIEELFELTRELLNCKNNCKTACHDCLKHFWNQRVHEKLDRRLALQLLDWMMYKKLADKIPFEEKKNLTKGLQELIKVDDDLNLVYESEKIFIRNKNKNVELNIYPSMWNEDQLDKLDINISDRMITKALPIVYTIIKNKIMRKSS